MCPELAQAWHCSCSCALVVERKALVSQVDGGESVGRAGWHRSRRNSMCDWECG